MSIFENMNQSWWSSNIDINGLVQDNNNPTPNALELEKSYTQPSMYALLSFSMLMQNHHMNVIPHLPVVDINNLPWPGVHFKSSYEFLNLRALKFSPVNKIHIFQCMANIYCVEFQSEPLKFHTIYLTHSFKYAIFIQSWNFNILDLRAHKRFWNAPQYLCCELGSQPGSPGLILGLSQWETALHCKNISHWLGGSLEWALAYILMCHCHHFLSSWLNGG